MIESFTIFRKALFANLWMVLLLVFFMPSLQAQNTTKPISGVVTNQEDGLPMIGVSVSIRGTNRGTVTDFEGNFALSAAIGEVLSVVYVGYESITVPVTAEDNYTIVLRESTQLLQDVVVIGYKKEIKSSVASSISSVRGEDIQKLPVLSIEQALQGQAPGIQITQVSGAPGDDIAIRIRGVNTIGNNNPLFIIDGVPTTGNINMFSINDIENIEVLKDGASAAIYGARAANGVVIITTKKGKSGKPSFTFDGYRGYQAASRLPELLNAADYLTIRNEAINNSNALRDPRRQLETYDPSILDTLPDVDWLSEVFTVAPIERYMLSATGGNEAGRYYIMGEYFSQDGTFRGQSFDRYSMRFNGEVGSKRVKIGNNLSFSFTDRKLIGSTGDGAGPGNELSGIRYAMIAAPVFPIYRPDGSYYKTSLELDDPILFGDGNANPLAFIDATNWNIQRSRLFGNVYVDVNLLEGLSFRTNLGVDFLFEQGRLFKERLSVAIYDPTSLTESRIFDRNLVWNNVLDYSKNFGRHRMGAVIGMEAIQNRTDYLGASVNNFFRSDPQFRFIDNSIAEELANTGVSGIVTEWALLSYFSQFTYNYDNRYILNAAVRRDGSSRFGRNNRWGNFPSVAAAWNVSNEPFFRNLGWNFISHLKIRTSWGRLGNQEIGLYPFSSLVETGRRVYTFNDQIATGLRLVEGGNNNIKWETTTQWDYGLDLSFFRDRFSLIIDYFNKTTSDILVRVPVPQAGGTQAAPFVNAGVVENKGWDFALVYKGGNRDFNYVISGNISTVANRVVSLASSEPILGGFGLSDGPITRTEPGYPIGSFFLYQSLGLFQNQAEIDAAPFQTIDTRPGDVRFADINGDGVIDDKDRAHVGSPFPRFIYGLSANFQYKDFDFSFLAQGIQGNDVYFLYGNFAYEVQLRGFNSYQDIMNRWSPENTNTDIPRVSVDDRNGNRRISTRFLEDGSFLRVRNVTLGYNLKKWLKTETLGTCRIYVSAQNLFTFTKYPGLDPEIQANNNDTRGFNVASDLAVGIDWATVPAPRTFIGGLRIEF